MELYKSKIFIKLKPNVGEAPTDKEEFKKWRSEQKISLGKWSEEQNRFTFEELKNHPNVGMVIPDGYIVVDVDDKIQAAKIHKAILELGLNCLIFNTGNGKHFLFKDPKPFGSRTQSNGEISLVGVKIDTRVSGKGYIAVKFYPDKDIMGNGDGNRLVQQMPLSEVEDLPFWLETIRLQNSEKAKKIMLDKWEEGNRDNNMMLWTNIVFNRDITSKKEMFIIFQIINNYLMTKPLFRDSKQLKTKVDNWIKHVGTQNLEYKIEYGSENQSYRAFNLALRGFEINYVDLTKHITKRFNIAFFQGKWWIKEKKQWYEQATDEKIKMKLISEIGNEAQKIDDKVFFDFLKVYSFREKTDDSREYINVKNGRVKWKTGEVENYNDEHFLIFGVDVEYNPEIKAEIVDEVFLEWTGNRQDEVDTLMEFIGSIFYPSNVNASAIILLGPSANNGKSTLLKTIEKLFDIRSRSDYITSINLSALEQRFGAYSLIGKRLIHINEIDDTFIDKSTVFKNVVTGDPIEVEGKYMKNTIRITPNQKFIGAANRFPRFHDQTDGVWRRIIILPFDFRPTLEQKKVFKETREKLLHSKEGRERLLFLAIQGIKRYMENHGFTESKRALEMKKKFQIMGDSIKAWEDATSNGETDEKWEEMKIGNTLTENYSSYVTWCKTNGYKHPVGKNRFKSELVIYREDLVWEKSGNKKPFVLKNKWEIAEEDIKEIKLDEIFK